MTRRVGVAVFRSCRSFFNVLLYFSLKHHDIMDNPNQPLDADFQFGSNQPDGLRITRSIRQYWQETGQWALFFAVLGFVYLGMMLLILLVASNSLGAMGIPIILAMLLVGGLMFPPVWFTFVFSRDIKKSLRQDDVAAADSGFTNLRRLYQYVGILTAIFLGFYALILMFSLLFSL